MLKKVDKECAFYGGRQVIVFMLATIVLILQPTGGNVALLLLQKKYAKD